MTSLWIVTNSEGADLACNLRAQAMEHAAEMAADFPQLAPWNVTEYVPARDLAAAKEEMRHQRDALYLFRDRQGGKASAEDITVGIKRLDAAIARIDAAIAGSKWTAQEMADADAEAACLHAAIPLDPAIAGSGEKSCHCMTCDPPTVNYDRMALCAICGNKRCPHATDHRLQCTNSNEPGQPGSAYA